MKRVLVALAFLALIPLLAGCGERASWHQKLVLEVETPNVTVSGQSVMRIDVRHEPQIIAHQGGIFKDVIGEAAFVDLGGGRYLFALLGDEANRALYTFEPAEMADGHMDGFIRLADMREARPLPRKLWPRLVTFTDIADPMTVRLVDPENLAASFGPGYRLRSVTLEITDEPVSEGDVEKVLEWLGSESKLDTAWKALNYEQKTAILGLRTPIHP